MVPYKTIRDAQTGETLMEIALTGQQLLDNSLLNKGSGFTEAERHDLRLLGLLPPHISVIEDQVSRNYENFRRQGSDLEKYIFLVSLQDRNETLFYGVLQDHIAEMMPIIYTPTVGLACQRFSHIYRRPRGLYLSWPRRHYIDEILANAPNPEVAVIVLTDGERVLGLGDLGIGGMNISVGKLSLYTLGAGIHPATTLPIFLDVGTDNRELLNDPLYLGWQHERVRGQDYDDFIEAFISALVRRFPKVLLQWEDFARHNARRLLERYRDRLCTFNDDIQGTGAVTLAGLLAAARVNGERLSGQRIVMFGAGSAATGIAEQIIAAMKSEGLSEQEAKAQLWLIDVGGLVHTGRRDLEEISRPYAQPLERIADWPVADRDRLTLGDVVHHVRPTALIGTAAQTGAFTEDIITEMARHVARPIIFPLSNPTAMCEASPADLLKWTAGRALVATGSPFPVVFDGACNRRIGQCNNAYIFPGLGLGVIASGARRVTQEMFVAAAHALSEQSPALSDPLGSLFPPLESVRAISRLVARQVGLEAQRAGLADQTTPEELERRIAEKMWEPRYMPYRLAR